MSSVRRSASKAKGCSWCRNAGDPEWKLHSIRDSRGRTVCPRLLAVRCVTCGKQGHTRKHCRAPKREEKVAPRVAAVEVAVAVRRRRRRTQRVAPAKPKAGFEVLRCASDSDVEEGTCIEEFPEPERDAVLPRVALRRHRATGWMPAWTPRPTGEATPKRSWADTDSDEEG